MHDVQEALAGLDLLLHPGDAEGLGTAVIEAMAIGVPTVAFDTGGIAEIVAHERNGLLVAPHDTQGFRGGDRSAGRGSARFARRSPPPVPTARDSSMSPTWSRRTLGAYRDLIERSAV